MRSDIFQLVTSLALLISTSIAAPLEVRDSTTPGISLTNKGTEAQTFYFFNNLWNGDATAGANFNNPTAGLTTTVQPGATTFVAVPTAFKGRVQRGSLQPATWVEFQVQATDGASWGDVSVEQGCDGAATISTTDAGSSTTAGFTNNVLNAAPAAAIKNKSDGTKAIANTLANWDPANAAAVAYMTKAIDPTKTYVTGGSGVEVVTSKNKRLAATFY